MSTRYDHPSTGPQRPARTLRSQSGSVRHYQQSTSAPTRTPRYETVYPARPLTQSYHAQRKRHLIVTGIATLMFAVAIGIVGWFSLQAIDGTLPNAGADARSTDVQTQSTPKSEWAQGVVPKVYQNDPAWSHVRYAENHFGESGCGPTCMAMVYAALTGTTDRDPAALAVFATENGYASADGTSWALMTEGAAALGLSAEDLPADELSIRRSIVAGRPVICSMGPGDFTSAGHFIVLVDIDQNGNLIVHDPNSPERTAKTWSFDTVISQCRNLWSYSLV